MSDQTSPKLPPRVKDITGWRFHRLVAIRFIGIFNRHPKWQFQCDCGNVIETFSESVRFSNTKSCGCYNRAKLVTHGASNTATFNSWTAMRKRCECTTASNFERYGGCGIKVCERWQKFENFLADMGERPSGTSIDRIDSNGNYELSNCRWATPKEQARNCRTNHRLSFNGRTMTVTEWAECLGFKKNILFERLKRGWSVQKSLTTPVLRK